MDATRPKGKSGRAYDGSGRKARARELRDATLEHARRLFLEHGYTATTVAEVAQAVGVSAATIYKTYGGKAGLVRDLCTQALAGEGTVPAEQRSNALRLADDPRTIIEGWGALVAEISPQVSPLLLLLRTAAETDHEAAGLYAELDQARLDRMADNAKHLASRHLRENVTDVQARDILWLCTSPELYELLVQQRGWTPRQLGEFVTDTIAGTLL